MRYKNALFALLHQQPACYVFNGMKVIIVLFIPFILFAGDFNSSPEGEWTRDFCEVVELETENEESNTRETPSSNDDEPMRAEFVSPNSVSNNTLNYPEKELHRYRRFPGIFVPPPIV